MCLVEIETWLRLLKHIEKEVKRIDGEGSGSPSSAGEGRGHPEIPQSGVTEKD